MKYCTSCGAELILLSDRYRPIQQLGQGGFGITYLAEDKARFNKPCVIKQLTLQNTKARQLFEGEAQRLEELADCPVIPRLLAYHSDVDYLYLVQEFVAGQDLDKELQKHGAFNEEQVKEFLQEILLVLILIHQKDIIHRDIKLENIMRREDGRLVLIDFGIAKLIPANNTVQPSTRVGTDGYASPEQIKSGIAKPASDLYSLGASCFHLLSNINPGSLFMDYGYQWTNKWQQHLKQPVSKEFSSILDKLLQYEYVDRYQSAAEVLKNVKSLNSHKTSPQVPKKVIVDPGELNRRATNKALAGAALAGLFVIITFAFIALHSSNQVPNNSPNSEEKNIESKPKVYFDQGIAQIEAGDNKGAIKNFDQAINLKHDYPYAHYNRGIARFNLGDNKGAIEDYTQAINLKSDSDGPYAYFDRGIARFNLGNNKGAIEDYNQAIKLQPDFSEAYSNRGIAKFNLGDDKGAVEDYDQAIKLKPDYYDAYNNRGDYLSIKGDQQGAINDFNKAIAIDPKKAKAYFSRGYVYTLQFNPLAAIKDYNTSISLDPKYGDAYFYRGNAYFNLGNYKLANNDFGKAISLYPNWPEAFEQRGSARSGLGDKQGKLTDFQQAAALWKQRGDEFRYGLISGTIRNLEQCGRDFCKK